MRRISEVRGVISVFLVIILVPMMTVSALFVDASRVKLAKGVVESAGDLVLNTALTDYDTALKDQYGLFATAQDTTELYERLQEYFTTCIVSRQFADENSDNAIDMIVAQLGLTSSNSDVSDLLNLEVVDFDVHKRTDATLANPTILKKQIIEFMKYRSPINTGLSFISALQTFTTLSKQTNLVDKRVEYYKEEESVMQNAKNAWDKIYLYNQSGFIKDDNYFPKMEEDFAQFETDYQEIAKKIIKDLYDAQNYGSFTPYSYTISSEDIEVNGNIKQVPVFYTNSENNENRSRKPYYTELTEYSDSNKATAEDIKAALEECYSAHNEYETAKEKLMEYNGNTYGQQFLIQTNRENKYMNWINAMSNYYDKYNELCHAVLFNGEDENGVSVMTTKGKLNGSHTEKKYSEYKEELDNKFITAAGVFNALLHGDDGYNATMSGYARNADVRNDAVAATIDILYGKATDYRKTISDAKENLDAAVVYLGYVYDAVKSGGSLDQKSGAWKDAASDSELKNTSMAKQDLAEIDSLSTYLREDDVKKLIDRLNNISANLGKMLEEIDSYTFFDTKIVEISDYNTMIYILKDKIGDDALKHVPTDKTELENQTNAWCENKFVIGKVIDTSWKDQSGTQAKLSGRNTDKLNFYSYLYTHFNAASEAGSATQEANKEKGENRIQEIKDKSSTATTNNTSSTTSGNTPATNNEDGKPNELNSRTERPSVKDSENNASETPSTEVKTGDNAAKDTSAGLGTLFEKLGNAIKNIGTDLRDKLYIADYILNMFSYDTLEKEFEKKNTAEDSSGEESAGPQTLTLVPIDAAHNYAYGREVEYIIYGGSNDANIVKAYATIYAIRFGFNIIYAFSDSEIRDSAFAIATPISAATLGVVPVPLIQVFIIVGITCAESAWDLNDLSEGESVPLFKSKDTWHCSPSNLLSEAVGEIVKKGTEVLVDEGTKVLGEFLDMTDEELNKVIDDGGDTLINSVEDKYDELITRHADTAIQKLTTLANNALEERARDIDTDMREYVIKGLDDWLEEEAQGVDTSNDLGYIVKKEAVNIIKDKFVDRIIDAIDNEKKNISGDIENLGQGIMSEINAIKGELTKIVSDTCDEVKNYKTEMKDKLKDSMKDGSQKLKDTLNEQLDGVFGGTSVGSKDDTGVASLLSFAYSDYLRLFLVIGLYTNERGVILRTADAIEANMAISTGNSGYKLNQSAAYVEINATIQAKPILLALPLFAEVEGNPTSDTNWYTFDYKYIKGY